MVLAMEPPALSLAIKRAAKAQGFHKVGIASLANLPETASLDRWLDAGFHADMQWMNNPKRADPKRILPEAQSLVCVALNYYTPHAHSDDVTKGKVSRYAWGRDYHKVLGKRLKALASWMESEFNCRTRFYVDTGPIAEKPWAMQAGLGWVGKNSLLLTREFGSWVFLGEVLTTLALESDRPHTDHCGTCTRCMTACPTQAIPTAGTIDSNRCIAYHTLENHAPELPEDITAHLHGWVAGCDICQDICPWNQRFARPTDVTDFEPYPDNVAPALSELADISRAEFDRRFPASALRRLKPERLRRNARAALKATSAEPLRILERSDKACDRPTDDTDPAPDSSTSNRT
ncbi:MAG: tRNA epoxyqueuosine(34) reductase QueG [Cyanobacteria bacterium P01_F01_bin.33]